MSENKVIFIVFCLVRTVHNSDFMLVTNEAPIKWGPAFVKKTPRSYNNRGSCILTQPVSLIKQQSVLTHP